jgi:heme/copper-type cytochrome/quinol oxidase subunit 2
VGKFEVGTKNVSRVRGCAVRARAWWKPTGRSFILTLALFLSAALLGMLSGCDYQSMAALLAIRSDARQSKISDPLRIQLTGTEHRWKVEYLAGDPLSNHTVVADGDDAPAGYDVHVPVGSNVVLVLRSNDFIYTLEIPELGLKEIAVPALEFRMTFCLEQAGTFSLVGEELCEAPEGLGMGRLVVEPRADFLTWLRSQKTSL